MLNLVHPARLLYLVAGTGRRAVILSTTRRGRLPTSRQWWKTPRWLSHNGVLAVNTVAVDATEEQVRERAGRTSGGKYLMALPCVK
ncbi:hypothetical protein KCP70_19510 [Salmonella enterica subsp. enterica]|nr:hypothetical protein KCP70_19510 [Salmonella enterica subsp. enterica]